MADESLGVTRKQILDLEGRAYASARPVGEPLGMIVDLKDNPHTNRTGFNDLVNADARTDARFLDASQPYHRANAYEVIRTIIDLKRGVGVALQFYGVSDEDYAAAIARGNE